MFTGIIEGIGDVLKIRKFSDKIEITIRIPFNAKKGDSISIDGVCLTVKEISEKIAKFDAVTGTVEKTTLKFLREGNKVNLERALGIDGRFGGHIVLGHVDGIGRIKMLRKDKSGLLKVDYPEELAGFIARKGSIAIDGISLTIAEISKKDFTINIIPFTIENTVLKYKKEGDYVNLEIDVISRYIKRIMEVNNGRY